MRALITGADGFVGRHLVAHLRETGDEVHEVIGGSAASASASGQRLDIRDREAVVSVVTAVEPDAIYHLAAVAYGPDAAADLGTAVSVTVGGTVHVLEAAANCTTPPTVLITGSSEVYGAPESDRIGEDAPTRPVNLYGATKLAQEALGLAFGRTHQVPVIATRSFNHIGPGQRDSFAIAAFARQLAEIGSGRRDPVLRVGNLASVRDFTDVRDVVRAYRRLVDVGVADAAINVASGNGIAVGDVLQRLIDAAGIGVAIETDRDRLRPNDPPRIVGDPSLLERLTAWKPRVDLSQTLADIWSDAVERWG